MDVDLPFRLQSDLPDMMHCLRARVIRSLFHLYEPFSLRVSKIPAMPESTPTTLLNSKVNDMLCLDSKGFHHGILPWIPYFLYVLHIDDDKQRC